MKIAAIWTSAMIAIVATIGYGIHRNIAKCEAKGGRYEIGLFASFCRRGEGRIILDGR